MSGVPIVVLFLFVTVGGGLLLYGAVRAERGQRRVMDRESAEKATRRDTDEPSESRGRDGENHRRDRRN